MSGGEARVGFSVPSRRRPSLSGHVGGAALLFVAAGMVVSALVELGARGEHFPHLMAPPASPPASGSCCGGAPRCPPA